MLRWSMRSCSSTSRRTLSFSASEKRYLGARETKVMEEQEEEEADDEEEEEEKMNP